MEDVPKKCATVTLLGRPSAGKSSFLNRACGERVSIVSPLPQTTRARVRGIVNAPQGQLVFIDTPGLYKSDKKMPLMMTALARSSARENDLVLYIMDSSRSAGEEESAALETLSGALKKCVVAINKTDLPSSDVKGAREYLSRVLADLPPSRIFEISAKTGAGVGAVLDALFSLAPEGPALYDSDVYTDQDVAFRLSEIIRGKAISRLRQEIPHAIYVDIIELKMVSENRLRARAVIYCERESQKGIIIGRGGAMIKAIREGAIREADEIFPYRVSLDISVKTDRGWRSSSGTLSRIIH